MLGIKPRAMMLNHLTYTLRFRILNNLKTTTKNFELRGFHYVAQADLTLVS
jgi:hypothetical protein